MKVVVVNICGNQGKTTLSTNLFYPRMPGCRIIAVESINATSADLGVDVERIQGENFLKVYAELVSSDSVVVDVGASSVEGFLRGLSSFQDGHDEVDLFVIPLTSGSKEQKEGLKTLKVLEAMGVPQDKIRVIFNKVVSDVRDEFSIAVSFLEGNGWSIDERPCIVYENEIYQILSDLKMTISDVVDIDKGRLDDLKRAMRSSPKGSREFALAYRMVCASKMSVKTKAQLDLAFENLF